MKKLTRLTMVLVMVTALFLAGCAAATPAPERTAPTEPTPLTVVAEAGDYSAKIFSMDPDATADIPDEPVPLAPSAEFDHTPGTPVTKRQAEAMAIQMAGLTQADVSFLFTKEDTEDGIDVFEISFRSGSYAYEFEIAAATGEVLSFEKEGF